ncbi:ferritin-like fold-containing protein [Microlunatus sp. Gsoil 973]|uniref:ferritin-like fold-containing protein n=1 Tax=Microlunatus sp. Gsoil 973 TaxID=2672569 RepID=UPI0012B49AD8|nr:ferritin-like fold-containing protein [Microlunatus sp. Gsoil 973]QGN32179.1 hydroxylase [Microlunatus sp. Gsoil 973]
MASDDAPGAALELLGVVAYGELAAFDRLAEDARLAPELADRVEMTGMAAVQYAHFSKAEDRIVELGGDVLAAMEPYRRPFDEFHALTRPKTWHEGLLKAYIGDGLASDVYREVSDLADDSTRELVHEVLAADRFDDFAVSRVRAAIDADPDSAGRLALWGRRLVGEAMSQAQRVLAERPALAGLLTGAPNGSLAEITRIMARLVENHSARMTRLGLSA